MLREEQAAKLLQYCETITNQRLSQIRGNLRKAETRAAAVLELLTIEAAAKVGTVEYEPCIGSSPDILLTLAGKRKVWIEVAFIYPRFWTQERQTREVVRWVRDEGKRRGIPNYKISFDFYGDKANLAGPVRKLPALDERKRFLRDSSVRDFFNSIEENSSQRLAIKHSLYSMELIYTPQDSGPFSHHSGLTQEAAQTEKEHVIYRILKKKAKQHREVQHPLVVLMGSDQSPVFSSFENKKIIQAVQRAFRERAIISGAITLNIKDSKNLLQVGVQKESALDIYCNPRARHSLKENDIICLKNIKFDRWKYFFSLEKYDEEKRYKVRRVGGNMTYGFLGPDRIRLEIPSSVLIDCLAGKTSLRKEVLSKPTSTYLDCIDNGWIVKSCSWQGGNIEQGKDSIVILELERPHEPVYWPKMRLDSLPKSP